MSIRGYVALCTSASPQVCLIDSTIELASANPAEGALHTQWFFLTFEKRLQHVLSVSSKVGVLAEDGYSWFQIVDT